MFKECNLRTASNMEIVTWLKEVIRIDYLEKDNLAVPMVCQMFTAKKNNGSSTIYRGCQLHGGKTKVCDTIKKKALKEAIEIEGCIECDEDDCNKSSHIGISSLCILLTALVFKTFY
jgi:hypothetical protein